MTILSPINIISRMFKKYVNTGAIAPVFTLVTNKDFKCYNFKTINLDISVIDNLEIINN